MKHRVYSYLFLSFFIYFIFYFLQAGVLAASSADKTPPSSPTGLKAVNKTYSSISLVWSKSSDNKGVMGYQLFRDGKKILSIKNTSYTNTNLIPGRKYVYAVKAYDSAGNISDYSNFISVETKIDNISPVAPGGLFIKSSDYTSITLCWIPSSDNTGIKNYEIYCNNKRVSSTSSTCYTCKRLTPGTQCH